MELPTLYAVVKMAQRAKENPVWVPPVNRARRTYLMMKYYAIEEAEEVRAQLQG